jgi:uncharacterized sulfatase
MFDLTREKLGTGTLFIFTSDHGAQWPFGKWNLYDAGIRVPLLAVWPGVIERGSSCDALVSRHRRSIVRSGPARPEAYTPRLHF